MRGAPRPRDGSARGGRRRRARAAAAHAAAFGAALLLVAGAAGRLRPPDAAAREARLEREVLDRSIAFLESRVASDADNPALASALVSRLFARFEGMGRLADLERARRIALRLAEIQSDTAATHARLATLRLARHDFAGALAAARTAVGADPASEAALAALHDAALAAGEYGEAERALAGLPAGRFARRVREAGWQASRGEADEAVRGLRGACGRLERRAVRAAVRAWCLAAIGDVEAGRPDPEAAGRWYRAALRLDPGSRAALEGLADAAHAAEEWRAAERLYRRLEGEAHPDIHLRIAEVAAARGKPAEAARWERGFLQLVASPEGEALGAHALALHLVERSADLDRALAVIERDLSSRRPAESWEVMARVRYRRGELREALAASDSARRRGPPSPTSDWHRADILEALGRRGEAAALRARAAAHPALLAPHVRRELRERRRAP